MHQLQGTALPGMVFKEFNDDEMIENLRVAGLNLLTFMCPKIFPAEMCLLF